MKKLFKAQCSSFVNCMVLLCHFHFAFHTGLKKTGSKGTKEGAIHRVGLPRTR